MKFREPTAPSFPYNIAHYINNSNICEPQDEPWSLETPIFASHDIKKNQLSDVDA